ncbi:hypothetical protein N665_4266s0002 [Sinapis alba]|nr:hypothetical protein N665_4266s0002 [Sinapis alba]
MSMRRQVKSFDDLFKTFGCGSVSCVHLKLFYNPTDKPKLFPGPLKSNHNIKRSTGIASFFLEYLSPLDFFLSVYIWY